MMVMGLSRTDGPSAVCVDMCADGPSAVCVDMHVDMGVKMHLGVGMDSRWVSANLTRERKGGRIGMGEHRTDEILRQQIQEEGRQPR